MSRAMLSSVELAFVSPVFCAPERVAPSERATREPDDPALTRSPRVHSAGTIAGVPAHEVVERLRAGDHAALTLVYMSLFEGLWRYAVLHTRAPSVAMDVVQDVFLSLWLKRETLRPDTDLGVFLAVAVRHNAINRSKRGRVGDRVAAAVAAEYVEMPGRGQEALAADARVEVDEFMAAYHRAVGTLTEREQAAAFLRWEEGWTFERIGEALGMSNVGARKLMLRAQAKVQALLAPFRR